MITVISISLALLVIVAGLLLLAKTKKEELGGLFTFSSYAIITCGILLVAHAFVGCILSCHSGGNRCGKSGYSQYHGGGHGGNSCATYGERGCKSNKSSYSHCRSSKKGCSKGGSSKSSCSKGSHSCKKDGKCCSKSKGGKKVTKTEGEDGKEEVNVTIEIIE